MQYVLPCFASPNSLSTPYRLHCGRLLAIVCAGASLPGPQHSITIHERPGTVAALPALCSGATSMSPDMWERTWALPSEALHDVPRISCGDEALVESCTDWIVWQGELRSVPLEPCPHKVSALHFVRETVWASMDACWGCVVVSSSMRGVTVVWCPLPLFSYMDSNAPLSHQVPLLTGAHRVRTR